MAYYKYAGNLEKIDHEQFDKYYLPGATPMYSGIYRCMGCGREVVAEDERKLPPQNHHQHGTAQGEIRWRLIVAPDPSEK
jgi:hypothetical protein